MKNTGRHYVLLAWLAFAFNALAALGCVVLIALAPDRASTWMAAGGLVFFALAAGGFATMLRLRPVER